MQCRHYRVPSATAPCERHFWAKTIIHSEHAPKTIKSIINYKLFVSIATCFFPVDPSPRLQLKMADQFEVFSKLEDIYPAESVARVSQRWAASCNSWLTHNLHLENFRFAEIKAKFVKEYGFEPKFAARAPGRVNLIGMCSLKRDNYFYV